MSKLFEADGAGGNVALPTRVVTRAQMIAWGESLHPVANSALGQLEGLTTPGPVSITDATAKTLSTDPTLIPAATETSETLAVGGAASLAVKTTKLNAAAGAQALTLANGTSDGQEKYFLFVGSGSAVWTLTANMVGFASAQFTKDAQSLFLRWDVAQTRWVVMGGNATLA